MIELEHRLVITAQRFKNLNKYSRCWRTRKQVFSSRKRGRGQKCWENPMHLVILKLSNISWGTVDEISNGIAFLIVFFLIYVFNYLLEFANSC